MSIRTLVEIYQFLWFLESQRHQRMAWEDAAEARTARARAERMALIQMQSMLAANPSGQLGHAQLDDKRRLKDAGLL